MKADTPKTYRLVEIFASNVKKLKAVAIKVDGSLFKISGRNEQGKSSVLDAVAMAIGGKEMFPEEPIRKGQDEAEIVLNFGDLKLTRRIWRTASGVVTHDVKLDFADGRRPKDKQDVLDGLRGSPIADDPIAFSRLKPRARFDMLRGLVPDYDFKAKAEARERLAEDRTEAGRLRDRAQGAADSITVPADTPEKPIDVTALGEELAAAILHNQQISDRARRREQAADDLETMRDRADQAAAALKKLNDEIAAKQKQIDEAEELPELIDTAPINAQINEASGKNAAYRRREEKADNLAVVAEKTGEYARLTNAIKAIDDAKQRAIENAKLPVPELSFGDDDILLDGLPFDQASTARKIRVSTALLMALKPELRVLLVREGSLLDKDARAALEADALANDFVVLMECVSEEVGAGGVIIEDGQVAT